MRDSTEVPTRPPEVTFGISRDGSTPATLATPEIANPERLPMTVTSVRLTRSHGLSLIGAVVVTPNDRAKFGSQDGGVGFPPTDWPYPQTHALGTTIGSAQFSSAPQQAPLTLKVAVGVQPSDDGERTVGFYGIDVDYVIGGDHRTQHFPHGLALCEHSPCVDADHALRDIGLWRPVTDQPGV